MDTYLLRILKYELISEWYNKCLSKFECFTVLLPSRWTWDVLCWGDRLSAGFADVLRQTGRAFNVYVGQTGRLLIHCSSLHDLSKQVSNTWRDLVHWIYSKRINSITPCDTPRRCWTHHTKRIRTMERWKVYIWERSSPSVAKMYVKKAKSKKCKNSWMFTVSIPNTREKSKSLHGASITSLPMNHRSVRPYAILIEEINWEKISILKALKGPSFILPRFLVDSCFRNATHFSNINLGPFSVSTVSQSSTSQSQQRLGTSNGGSYYGSSSRNFWVAID